MLPAGEALVGSPDVDLGPAIRLQRFSPFAAVERDRPPSTTTLFNDNHKFAVCFKKGDPLKTF